LRLQRLMTRAISTLGAIPQGASDVAAPGRFHLPSDARVFVPVHSAVKTAARLRPASSRRGEVRLGWR